MLIDPTFDFRSDSPPGKDVDSHSKTLKRYHQVLWSKPLPNGGDLRLEPVRGDYLGDTGIPAARALGSDSIAHTYAAWFRTRSVIEQIPPDETVEFLNLAYTIGGFILFPRYPLPWAKNNFNQVRARSPIDDRFDLALECIARSYDGDLETPLGPAIDGYRDFFALFRDFAGYVDFWLLQDLVGSDGRSVRYFLPFDGFAAGGYPRTVPDYIRYREEVVRFVSERGARITDWSSARR